MKLINNKIWLFIFVITCAIFASCDDVVELNVDPNNPTAVPAANLVTQGQYSLYNRLHSRGYNAEWGMLMVQHWAQNEYAEDSRYIVDANTFNGTWSGFYSGTLIDLKIAKGLITDDTDVPQAIKANQIAIIDILMADAFQALTDGFGSIPYTQALSDEFPNPSYDDQSVIYADLLSKVDAALGAMDVNSSSFASGDAIFGGDVTSWKKLGASLLLRMAMRVSDKDSALASDYVSKAIAHGPMSSTAENATFVFDAANPALSNPLFIDAITNGRDDFAISEFLAETMVAMGDPRLDNFANTNNDDVIKGMPYGLLDAAAFALKSVTSRPADAVRAAAAPHVIMDYAEVAFLMAEAIERSYATGDAAAMYDAGVTASMEYWGITDTTMVSDYLTANAYDAANWKQSIGTQKWIAFYMNGAQAWAEWRRLDFPLLTVPTAANIPTVPVRLPYPISEDTNNGSNLDAITSDINDLTTKVWWDVN